MSRTISVIGNGSIRVTPDMIRLSLTMNGSSREYADAVRLSAKESETLRDCIEAIGFKKADLKTTSFTIDAKYESCRDEKNEYIRKFVGYEYRHSAYVAMNADSALLSRVLSAIAESGTSPEFHIEYTSKNPEVVRRKLLAVAVLNAKAKAACIAEAAGVELCDIESIDYSCGDMPIVGRPIERAVLCAKANDGDASFGIEPDDITITDSVRIVWSIR